MSSSPPAPRRREPGKTASRLALTVLHLACMGLFGWLAIAAALTLAGVGVGTAIIGVGLALLVALVYVLFGMAWFENERVAGLFQPRPPKLSFAQQQRPGFGGYLRSLTAQLRDERMWQAIGSFTLASIIGALMLTFVQTLIWSITAPIEEARTGVVGNYLGFGTIISVTPGGSAISYLLAAVLGLGGIIGCAYLHDATVGRIARASAQHAALQAAAAVSAQRRDDAVRAADVERTRFERDLHDGVQPRLVSVGMTLGLAQQQIDSNPEAAKQLLAEAHSSTKEAITELRQLARGLHPSVLDDRGLDAALSALAGRSHIPVVLDVRLGARPTGPASREADTAVYFAVSEALTNAAKHSGATECRVIVRERGAGGAGVAGTAGMAGDTAAGGGARRAVTDPPLLWARIEDNGVGGARVLPGGGLDGIARRIAAAGGTLRLDSPAGGPTTVEVSVPCAF